MRLNIIYIILKKSLKYLPLLLLLGACEDEPIPSYIYIPSINVTTSSGQGSTSSKITDAWVYENANLQGVYEMPVQFPILIAGEIYVVVYGGIKLNGISTTHAEYPFYVPDTIKVTLEPGAIDTIYPDVTYSANAEFALVEGFEGGAGFSNMDRTSVSSDVLEGSYSGAVMTSASEVIAKSNSDFVIPYNSRAVFLEMDYRNTHLFEVGIEALYGTDGYLSPKILVPARSEWNKLYVNFTPEVNQLNADSYRVYFKVAGQADPSAVKILLDNLKLIYAKV